jgi:exosortase/archaeosortase family protein
MNITIDDPRLTAYALDELDEAGRSVIEGEIKNFDECRREVEEIARAAALIRGELASEPMPAWSPARLAIIEGQLRPSRVKPKSSWLPPSEEWAALISRMKTALAVVLMMLVGAVLCPQWMKDEIQTFHQKASAESAFMMIKMAGTTVFKDGLILTLPDAMRPGGMSLMVERTCAPMNWGFLWVTASVLLGGLYLRSPWKRLLLTLFVLSLVIVDRGLRIFTLAELCVHVSGEVIDSPIYHEGGPIYFLLSLIPFVLFLRWLRKLEHRV